MDSDRIIMEKDSYSTLTNLEQAKELADRLEARRIGIVTGKAHMSRTRRFAENIFEGYNVHYYPVETRNLRDFIIEGISLFWEIFSSFNSHGVSYYLKKS